MKKAHKIIGSILCLPLCLFALAAGMLYMPPVQEWAVDKATAYAHDELGCKIEIKSLRLRFPFYLKLEQLTVHYEDTPLVRMDACLIDLDIWQLLRMQPRIKAFQMQGVEVTTAELIPSTQVKTLIGEVSLESDPIYLLKHRMLLTEACISDGFVHIVHRPEEETSDTLQQAENIPWQIDVQKLALNNIQVTIELPSDTMKIATFIAQSHLKEAFLDLKNVHYRVGSFHLASDSLHYDGPSAPSKNQKGIDPNHLRIADAIVTAGNVDFYAENLQVAGKIRIENLNEQSGFTLEQFEANICLSDSLWNIDSTTLRTPHSQLGLTARMANPLRTAWHEQEIEAWLDGMLGISDIPLITGTPLPLRELNLSAADAIDIHLALQGRHDTCWIKKCELQLHKLAQLKAEGYATSLIKWDEAVAHLHTELQLTEQKRVKRVKQVTRWRLPSMHMQLQLDKNKDLYTAHSHISEGEGTTTLSGKFNTSTLRYQGDLRIEDMHVDHFLPYDSIFQLNARARIEGIGTDLTHKNTNLDAQVQLTELGYKGWNLHQMGMTACLKHQLGELHLYSQNECLDMHTTAHAQFTPQRCDLTTDILLNKIDLAALQLTKDSLTASLNTHIQYTTDGREMHQLKGLVHEIELCAKDTLIRPLNLSVEALTHPDTTYLRASAGDLEILLASPHGYNNLTKQIDQFNQALRTQAANYHIHPSSLSALYPQFNLHIHSGNANPIQNVIRYVTGFSYKNLSLDLHTDPLTGIQGRGNVCQMRAGYLPIDTFAWEIVQDSNAIKWNTRVYNTPKNKRAVFSSHLNATLTDQGSTLWLDFYDGKKRKGIDLGLHAKVAEDGVRFHFMPAEPTIAYRTFRLNQDNLLHIANDGRILANLNLEADDGTGLKMFSAEQEEPDHQDLSLEIKRINLGELSSVIPYLPPMSGFLDGDLHMQKSYQTLSFSADVKAQQFAYNQVAVGDIELETVYLPNDDGTHFIDGILSYNQEQVAYVNGTYNPMDTKNSLQAELQLEKLPLHLVNGFIPNHTAELYGVARGEATLSGSTQMPVLNGLLSTEGLVMKSTPYSLQLTIPDDTIRISNNQILFQQIKAYAAGRNPLTLDGLVAVKDANHIGVDLQVAAKNYSLINASKTHAAEAYGKVNVDLDGRIRGTLDNLTIRGALTVLGNTDVTYILPDSPISTEDQLSEIVKFVDTQDTLYHEQDIHIASPSRMDMLFNVDIQPGTQVHCLLSADGSDYVNLEGGGNFILSYNKQNDLLLNGRYTILSGDMKYSLMELVNKHFTISPDSYVEFNGNLENPSLNILATERVKSTVNDHNVPRSVVFDVGLKLSQTLNRLGMEFTLDAPEDMSVQNELAAMSTEQKGRAAVTMLATGMYLTDNHKANSTNTTNALYNYLHGQINNLAGKALKTVDLNFGIENTLNQTGGSQTDYNFSFAKRFWGNRIRIAIGGKVSSGNDVSNTGQSILDNVSLEYRLDQSANRYVKVYYDKNYESILEGELTEMGAGVVFRRKSKKLSELFQFKKKKKQ